MGRNVAAKLTNGSTELATPKLYTTNTSSSRQSGAFCVTLTKPLNTNKNNKVSLKCRQTEYHEEHKFNNSTGVGEIRAKVFVGHSIYKGKAALTVEPRGPEFAFLDSGAYKLSREGFVMLQFDPATGVRRYDWTRKQIFSLSVTEIGTLVSLGARDSCVQNRLLNVEESIYIPVTKAEFAVLMAAFSYILPFLLGWHAFVNSMKPDDVNRSNNASSRYGGDNEWNR